MRNKSRNQAGNLGLSSRLITAIVLILILLVAGSSLALAQEDLAFIRQVQVLENEELGLTRPAGLAYSPAANALMVVEAPEVDEPFAMFTGLKVITQAEGRVGTVLLLVAVADPLHMAFDAHANRLLLYQSATGELIEVGAGPDGYLRPAMITRHDARQLRLEHPQGMAVDPASGQLLFLDGAGPRIVSVAPGLEGDFRGTEVSRVDLDQIGQMDLRGLAFDPMTGHLHVLAPVQEMLYELTLAGDVVASRDLSPFGLGSPQSMVFAPSGDLTDDPAKMSLYIADSGLGGGRDRQATWQPSGRIVELSFDLVEPQATTATATLVRTIDTSLFDPPSPDPAGITYLESSDTLMMSDSEVNEMPIYFTGDNLFEFTRQGSLVRTSRTTRFTDEPTGVGLDPAGNGLMFFSDDVRDEIYVVDLGGDGEFDPGDSRTSFDTAVYGNTDPEGVAYDTWNGVLFISDGVNNEVYRIDPGNNGVFDGVPDAGGDDEMTHWDTAAFGITDPGGITFDPESGHLYLVGRPNDQMAHVTTGGTLLRMIDISAAGAMRPAGLTSAPGSVDPSVMNVYVADRRVDNNDDPTENDGKVYELFLPALEPDVAIAKTADPPSAPPGGVIAYTLAFSNAGGGTATGVVITDIIPVTVTVQSWNSSGAQVTDTGADPPYVWAVEDLSAGEGGEITIVAELAPDLSCGDSFKNTVSIDTTSNDTRPGNDSSEAWASAGVGVSVDPSSRTKKADQGDEVVYRMDVTNDGLCEDTFDISVGGTLWPVSGPTSTGPLAPGESTRVRFTVTVPEDAPCGPEVTTITFTSQADGFTSASAVLTTSVNPVYGLTVEPPSSTVSGDPGTDLVHTLWVTNTGNCVDTFDLAIEGGTWAAQAPASVEPLAAGLGTSVDVVVTAECGQDIATATFTSQGDGISSASSVLTSSADPVRGLTVEPATDALSGDPGTDVVYTLRVTNTGNCPDTFAVAISNNAWFTEAPETVGELAADEGADVEVTVTVSETAGCGENDMAIVTLTSEGDDTKTDGSALITSANTVYEVTVEPQSHTGFGAPGTVVTHTLRVTNAGNCEDTFDVAVGDHVWITEAPDTVGPLAGYEGADVDISVSVPACTPGGDSDPLEVTFTSQHDGTASGGAALTTTASQIAPVASDDEYEALEDTPLTVEAPGVLGNDDDINCEPLNVSDYTQPNSGSVMIMADGSFIYTPTPNAYGEDSFTYLASDGVLTDTGTVTITVLSAGDDPIVDAGDDQSADEGEIVSFAGSFVDPARTLAAGETIHWDFGDGETTTGTLTPIHVFDDNGEYTVTLSITNLEGDVGQDSLVVAVENVAPSVDAGPDQNAMPGELLSFSGSFTDPGVDDTWTIEWDLGNGTVIQDTLAFDYTYADAGIYTVTLTVTDDDGGVGTDTVEIRVLLRTYLPVITRAAQR